MSSPNVPITSLLILLAMLTSEDLNKIATELDSGDSPNEKYWDEATVNKIRSNVKALDHLVMVAQVKHISLRGIYNDEECNDS